MGVDLMSCYTPRRADDQLAIQEAAAASLRRLELLVSSLSAVPRRADDQLAIQEAATSGLHGLELLVSSLSVAPRRADDQLAIQEAAAADLRSLELLVSSLSAVPHKAPQQQRPFGEIADQAVSKFRKVISILDRTGHARFCHRPVKSPPPASLVAPTPPPPAPVIAIVPVAVALTSQPQSLTLEELVSAGPRPMRPMRARPHLSALGWRVSKPILVG